VFRPASVIDVSWPWPAFSPTEANWAVEIWDGVAAPGQPLDVHHPNPTVYTADFGSFASLPFTWRFPYRYDATDQQNHWGLELYLGTVSQGSFTGNEADVSTWFQCLFEVEGGRWTPALGAVLVPRGLVQIGAVHWTARPKPPLSTPF
jgi:hypothetical protein